MNVFLLILVSFFACFTLFTCWFHQNKEIITYGDNASDQYSGYRKALLSETDLVAFYSLQDEQLNYGKVRDRRTVLPTALGDLKPVANEIIGRVISSRWEGKRGIELDSKYLRLPAKDVTSDQFTLSVWLRQNGPGTIRGGNFDAAATLIALGDGSSTGWGLDFLSPSNRVIFHLHTPKDRQQPGICGSLRIPPRTWINLAVMREPQRIRLYINGLLAGERTHEPLATPVSRTSNLKIGYAGNGFSSCSMQVDEICIWSTAISSSRVLCNSLLVSYHNDSFENLFELASDSFANCKYERALHLFNECLMEPTLPSALRAAIDFRRGEIHAILGHFEDAKKIFSNLVRQQDTPMTIRCHSLHELLHIQEKQITPSDSDLSAFSVANSILYGELSHASLSYKNAMLEYDFSMPLK